MQTPTLKPDDFCICLEDPWTSVRSLVVENIENGRATVRPDGTQAGMVKCEVIALSKLAYNPYRNHARRMSTGVNPTTEQQQQLDNALLVRVVTANITADRKKVELAVLKQGIAELLPELSDDLIDICLRAMTASSALIADEMEKKKSNAAANKIKLIASEDMLRSEQYSAFAYSFADELSNQSRRFGRLVEHRGTAGGYREELLRALLRRTLAERYHVATGFIDGCDLQLDVIIYDRIDYAPVFREGDLVVVPMDSVRAVLEVKTRLTTSALKDALEHLHSLPFELKAPIFKGVFAFDTAISDKKILGHVAKHYEDYMTLWGQPYDEVTAICVLEKQLVLSAYANDPIRPVLLLMRNLLGRNFQATVFLDAMQNYLRTPAPRVLPDGLSWRSRVELGATSLEYLQGTWKVTMDVTYDDEEVSSRERALERIKRTERWLVNDDPW